MAGAGSRFVDAGYAKPKPFIDVCGRMMIERVLDNLTLDNARFIVIGRQEHLASQKDAFDALKRKYNCHTFFIDKLTEGAACTVLLSSWLINTDDPLLMANSDQIVEMDLPSYIRDCDERNLDGSILTFYADHPKWSYAKINDQGHLTILREKEVISEHATVGIYYFKRGRDFVNSAIQMIAHNDRVNNEFYTAPAYNYAVKAGLTIGIFEIDESRMFGLGTPEDLDKYIDHINRSGLTNENV